MNGVNKGHGAVDQGRQFPEARDRAAATATFLLTGVEQATSLWEMAPDAAVAALARHRELIAAAVAAHGGVQPDGSDQSDGVLAVFDATGQAVAAALEVQRAFAAEPWPSGLAVRVRIGLYTGEVRGRDGRDHTAVAADRCARVRDVAHGGQTLLSAATAALVADALPAGAWLEDVGVHRLRDLARPEQLFALRHAELDGEFPPPRSLDVLPNNLPAQLTSFVGRTAELAEVRRLCGAQRLVTVAGSGGCGKTRMAVQVAADLADRWPDGVWWVDLGSVADTDLVVRVTAAALRVLVDPAGNPLHALAAQLRGRRLLVCLDTCEHLLDACAELADTLLRACPGVSVLATSREPLGVPGETVWRVPSLTLEESVGLFADRAALARPGFDLDAHADAVRTVCRRLDGIPLAIELAAAWVRALTPAQIAAGMDDRLGLLTGGPRGVIARHRTLAASMDWSHALLEPADRVVFRQLAVFAGGFTLDAARAVCATGEVPERTVLAVIGRLVDQSLITVGEGDGEVRYRLLDSIREYAEDRLEDAGETNAARDRHLDHFLAFAEAAEPELERDQDRWRAVLEAEHDNLRAALRWGLAADGATSQQQSSQGATSQQQSSQGATSQQQSSQGATSQQQSSQGATSQQQSSQGAASQQQLSQDPGRGRRLVAALARWWYLHGHIQEGLGFLRRAVELAPGDRSSLQASLLTGTAMVAFGGARAALVGDEAARGLEIAAECGDDRSRARCLGLLSYLPFFTDFAASRELAVQAQHYGEAAGDRMAADFGMLIEACTITNEDRHHDAVPLARTVYERTMPRGERFCAAIARSCQSWAALFTGDLRHAEVLATESLRIAEPLGDFGTVGLTAFNLAWVKGLAGEIDAGRRLMDPVVRAVQNAGPELELLPWLSMIPGKLHLWGGDLDGAVRWLERATRFAAPMTDNWVTVRALPSLAGAYRRLGRRDDAREQAERAVTLARTIGTPHVIAEGLEELAFLAASEDPARAEDLHHQALAVRVEHGLRTFTVDSLDALAGLAAAAGSAEEAARLLAAVDTAREQMGYPRPAINQPDTDATLAAARAPLGDGAFATAWAAGAALSLDEAVAYATRARGARNRPSTGWASLTPTELDVAGLVVEGLSNAEIGARLFVSRATVKTHLSHIYAKLGVANRTELATLASSRPGRPAPPTA